jgi:hypothetical protein
LLYWLTTKGCEISRYFFSFLLYLFAVPRGWSP